MRLVTRSEVVVPLSVPTEPFSTPSKRFPELSKLPKFRMLNADRLGSSTNRSPSFKGRDSVTSKVFNQARLGLSAGAG